MSLFITQQFILFLGNYFIFQQPNTEQSLLTGCPRKNGALACCYSRANAPFFLGHPVDISASENLIFFQFTQTKQFQSKSVYWSIDLTLQNVSE